MIPKEVLLPIMAGILEEDAGEHLCSNSPPVENQDGIHTGAPRYTMPQAGGLDSDPILAVPPP